MKKNTIIIRGMQKGLLQTFFSTIRNSYVIIMLTLLMASCSNQPLDIDVSGVAVPPVVINRLDQDVFKIDTGNIVGASEKLEQKYGHFFSTFMIGIINNGGIKDSSYSYKIKGFINDRDMRKAYNDCQKAYPNTDDLANQFKDVFKHFKHYFPDKALPRVATMMSGFNRNVVTVDSTIGIGLEMYLGDQSEFYQMLTLPRYKTMFMNKDNIVPDAVRSWMLAEFPYNMDKSDLISQITYIGKIMYASDALMPRVPDTIKTQYSQKQLDYCIQNEFNIWSYFAAQKLLYTTDQAEVLKYTSDGPFTSAISKESAPRIGYWTGWQIVKQFMKNNPNITIEQLMNETDAQKILTKAKYKPAK